MSDEKEDIFEKAFGKKPESGYEFKRIDIQVIDSESFKGLDIGWLASGIGFGHVTIAWGMGDEIKEKWPRQYGFHTDTENMSEDFVEALLVAAAPQLAKLIMESERE